MRSTCVLLLFGLLRIVQAVDNFTFTIERVSISKDFNQKIGFLPTTRFKRLTSIYNTARNVTSQLNRILANYDKSLRPRVFGGGPTQVFIDINVRTMGLISEKTDTYSFDCYFRQTWQDDRLRFSSHSSSLRVLSLSTAMLDRIWKPDVYFWNDAGSYVHKQTVPNRLVRLSEDGTVLFSMRLTIKAKCRMHLKRYPLDKQACRLVIGSFAYPKDDMTLKWKPQGGVQIDYDAIRDLPQFSVNGFTITNMSSIMRDQEYSALEVQFFLVRHFGYFLMNFYVPSTLIVLLCWVAFWINRESTQERIVLVITNVLSMIFMMLDSKADSPKTDFPTALDVYIWICFAFLFFCMIEFTFVHYFTKYNKGDPEVLEIERDRIRHIIRSIPKTAVMGTRHYNRPGVERRRGKMHSSFSIRRDGGRYSMYNKARRKNTHQPLSTTHSDNLHHFDNIHHFHQDAVGWRLYYYMMDKSSAHDPFLLSGNSISSIDIAARVVLPITFSFVVLIYYQFYVGSPEDIVFETPNGPSI